VLLLIAVVFAYFMLFNVLLIYIRYLAGGAEDKVRLFLINLICGSNMTEVSPITAGVIV
jgi:hypothetical protein